MRALTLNEHSQLPLFFSHACELLTLSFLHGMHHVRSADQRVSRQVIRDLSSGRSVLDLCCFTGGFALAAAAGGAASSTGVDSSAAAVELAQRNAELNAFPPTQCSFVKADVGDYMRAAAGEGRQWDIVILGKRLLVKQGAGLRFLLCMGPCWGGWLVSWVLHPTAPTSPL
jgi:tRNA/tmRNA/rRNA uracil-C5-methylase (TrmA/RlmC/RlmD family)